ncbi:hypothetical protein LSAT2_032072 [Lamellibrachia satsuma]|nr:hypothetical protein LSAT2_032072 [Lamellibrachia satsuma]
MSGAWGTLPVTPEPDSGIAAIELEQMMKARPMEVEGPPLYQPCTTHVPPSSEVYTGDEFSMDPTVLHTIELLQYARQLRMMITSAKQQLECLKSMEGEIPLFTAVPQIPEYQGPPPKHQLLKPVPFLARNPHSLFVRGIGSPPPQIDSKNCHKLLKRSVATLCAHSGYDSCSESVLDTMTDICGEYFLQLTKLLRRSVDTEAQHGMDGFQDPIERVFHEMGVGSMMNLHTHYTKHVLHYHDCMLQTCEELRDKYTRLTSPAIPNGTQNMKPLLKLKVEPLSDIQFPANDYADEGGESDQMIQLEGLGLDIGMGQESTSSLAPEEDTRWSSHIKTETSSDINRVSGPDSYDQDDNQSTSDVPTTPTPAGSDAGDSGQDPGSVSALSESLSSPSLDGRTLGKPVRKKRRR